MSYLSKGDGASETLTDVLVTGARSTTKTKYRQLAEGPTLFYEYTKKSLHRPNMILHSGSRVYALDLKTGEETTISESSQPKFMVPATHVVGGKDAVLLIEGTDEGGYHLVTALADGSKKKRLCPVNGYSTIQISPDQKRVALMQQDLPAQYFATKLLQGNGALDPESMVPIEQLDVPLDRVIMGMFFSPDSKKLLFLVTKAKREELSVSRSSLKMGFHLEFQWIVYDCGKRTSTMYQSFIPRTFFVRVKQREMDGETGNTWG
ncbi:unnamed protein product [Discosporangium mesarthrocarpum]